MAKKKEPLLTAEEIAEAARERFVREVQKRIQDKNHYEIADAIVWAMEQMISGEAFDQEEKSDIELSEQ